MDLYSSYASTFFRPKKIYTVATRRYVCDCASQHDGSDGWPVAELARGRDLRQRLFLVMAKMRLLVVLLLLLLLLQPAPVVPAGQHRRQHYSSGSQLHPMAGNMATAPRGAGGGSLLSAAVAAVGQAAPLHLPLQHAGGKPIDARVDYGCVGDGHADDTACLQAALDAGGVQGRRVYIPGGTYAVSEPLLLKGSNSTWANQQWNATFGPIPVSGDGTGQTIIRAAASGKCQ